MKAFFFNPWPWWLSGIGISVVMFLLIFSGKQFSCSSNFRTICAAAGLGKRIKFFDFKWKRQTWNLFFLLGAMIGGYIAHHYLTNENRLFKFGTKKMGENLQSLNLSNPADSTRLDSMLQAERAIKTDKNKEASTKENVKYQLQPNEIFGIDAALTLKGFAILALGGLLIGFGTRYAGGCTSGHAISGLSNLQLPSLVSVISFFIGGILMVHFLFPFIFK